MTTKSAEELKGIQRNVYEIVSKYPSAANDDAMLLDIYWHTFDDYRDDKSLYWNLQRVTQPETITRRRRELHNMGLIRYSEQADTRRAEAFRNEKEYAAVSWLNDE